MGHQKTSLPAPDVFTNYGPEGGGGREAKSTLQIDLRQIKQTQKIE